MLEWRCDNYFVNGHRLTFTIAINCGTDGGASGLSEGSVYAAYNTGGGWGYLGAAYKPDSPINSYSLSGGYRGTSSLQTFTFTIDAGFAASTQFAAGIVIGDSAPMRIYSVNLAVSTVFLK